MNETKIVIDAGHGGSDPGASGNGIIEKDLTLAISKYMYDRFKELAKITKEHNGLWSKEAEDYLLANF